MIIPRLVSNLIFVILLSSKKYIAESKMVIKKNQENIDFMAKNFSELMVNLEIKYTLIKHVVYMLPFLSENDTVNQVMDIFLQKLCSRSYLVTIVDFDSCGYLEEEIDYHKQQMVVHYPGSYVIPILPEQSIRVFNVQLESMARRRYFNPKAIFIIVIFQGNWHNLNYAELFNVLWTKNYYSAILLEIKDGQLISFWAKPFSINNRCRKVETEIIKYDPVEDLKEDSVDIYKEEYINNYRGCAFLVGTIHRPPYVIGTRVTLKGQTHYVYKHGIEIELFKLLASKTNFTLKFSKTLSYNNDAIYFRFPNGSEIGTLQDVSTHKIDATVGGLSPSFEDDYKFDYVFPYRVCTICFFLADAGNISSWKLLVAMFDSHVWTLSICVFVVFSVVYCWFRQLLNHHRGGTKDLIVFIDMLRMNLGFGVNFRQRSLSLRILFFAWIVYSLHWDLIYTTHLVALQTNNPKGKEISTIAELLESGIQVRLNPLLKALLGKVKMDLNPMLLLNRSETCKPINCLPDLLQHRNFSLLTKSDVFIDLKSHSIHILPEPLLTYSVAIVLSKGNPLSGPLQRLCLKALEAGLTGQWEREAERMVKRDTSGQVVTRILSLSDLRGAFFLLFYGLFIAICALLIEIIVYLYDHSLGTRQKA